MYIPFMKTLFIEVESILLHMYDNLAFTRRQKRKNDILSHNGERNYTADYNIVTYKMQFLTLFCFWKAFRLLRIERKLDANRLRRRNSSVLFLKQ